MTLISRDHDPADAHTLSLSSWTPLTAHLEHNEVAVRFLAALALAGAIVAGAVLATTSASVETTFALVMLGALEVVAIPLAARAAKRVSRARKELRALNPAAYDGRRDELNAAD